MSRKYVQIRHSASDTLIAEGPLGWGITPFEGNYYISRKYLFTDGFRVAVPGAHPEISIERYEKTD